jgi:hypothetical protein
VKAGETYTVSTRHQFEGKYVESVRDEDDNVTAHVFDCGERGKGGKHTKRIVPARTFIGATKVK